MTEGRARETEKRSFLGPVFFLLIIICMAFAGGYIIGTKYPAGNLRSPVSDRLYKLKLVAVPRSDKFGGNYDFEGHFKGTSKLMQEVGLDQKIVTLDNGVFKFVTFENN